jgi:hypothetical protein
LSNISINKFFLEDEELLIDVDVEDDESFVCRERMVCANASPSSSASIDVQGVSKKTYPFLQYYFCSSEFTF